ncbi:MAG: TonB-dependent receptor [Methylococcales bacterium]
MNIQFFWAVLLLWLSQSVWADSELALAESDKLLDLNIEDLVNVKVTSVSKKVQSLSDAPAAIFVISHEDLKRSGVTSLPEALRMAPGIEVARINSSKWAISARGFNGAFANKLLVLIDGRSVYTPAFSGVYWDAQDVLMEDVERIEVIRGPGATLWGANAVNGVIDIITKHSEDTQGGMLTAGGGTKETGFGSLRYGQKMGDDTFARAYIKGFQRDDFQTPAGLEANDAWNKQQGGFRLDSQLTDQDQLTLSGDLYRGRANHTVLMPNFGRDGGVLLPETQKLSGWNVTSKWQHSFSATSAANLQFYYDRYNRTDYLATQRIDTLDIDFNHNFSLSEWQNVVWGLGYRYTQDKFSKSPSISFSPDSRGVQLVTGFVQDEFMLVDEALWFTLGSKFEHNDYTGFEGQPTAKLMWSPAARHKFWTSVSRAVRTPSRGERNADIFVAAIPPGPATFNFPVSVVANGNSAYHSEVLLAYELGYRFALHNLASLDVTAFYNDYSRLRSASPGTLNVEGTYPNYTLQQNIAFTNNNSANTYGVEIATVWQMLDWWRWDANYSFLHTGTSGGIIAVSPEHKASLRAGLTPVKDLNLDLWLRYTGATASDSPIAAFSNTGAYNIKAYLTMDVRLGWKPHESWELSITGQNLLDDYHPEYLEESLTQPTEIARGVYGKIAWQF